MMVLSHCGFCRVVVDPDLYWELAPQSENPLLMKFRDLSSVSEPLRWLGRAEKETAVASSSSIRTSPPGFPVEESFDFQTAGGGRGVVSYSSPGCHGSNLQGEPPVPQMCSVSNICFNQIVVICNDRK